MSNYMIGEIFDGNVSLKVRGQKPLKWENPSMRELEAICEEVANKINRGIKVDEFEFRRNLKTQ